MTQKQKGIAALILVCSVLAVAFISLASAQTANATITASATSDSSVIALAGTGFDASGNVTLQLLNETTQLVIYNFTETITTDTLGNFTGNVTLPTATYGTFNLTAHTSTVSAHTEYTIMEPITNTTTITVTPDDSNIIQIKGSGFNASETVATELLDSNNDTAYTFSNETQTDALGNFTVTEIIPTNISGSYTLVASTSSRTANATITVPDLTGATGTIGATGANGADGAAGTAGASADETIGYVAIVLSIVAIIVGALTFLKKQ